MVQGNVGQSKLTRKDMTRYIRYLVDVIGNEQRALYSYLEDRTNPYICLHGECQTLADWISVLLEAYNESFDRWDLSLDLLVFDQLVTEMTVEEMPKQITDWDLIDHLKFQGQPYLHTVIEWDGLCWDANGGSTRRDKEEYYDEKIGRKKLLRNFFDLDEMKDYLEWPLVEESIDYTWHWTEGNNGGDFLSDELWIEEMELGISPYENLEVFRDFINHLRSDDFAAERIYFDDEYGGFIKGNPRANELPGPFAGQSDLTREDMTRYIRYLVDVIGNEQKALYSYLEDRTNPYICLHGECQTLADWISVLLEAYNQPFQRWNMELDLLVFGRLVNEMKPNEVPKQIRVTMTKGEKMSDDLRGRKYCHTVIEWDGLYWDANGGGTQRDKEEYYDKKIGRKKLLRNFFDLDEMKDYLEWPLVEESIDYTWHWTEGERGDLGRYNTVKAWVGKDKRAWMTQPRDDIGQFIKRADNIYIGDEYGGFVKSNPDAVNLPGVVELPGEQERIVKWIESFMPLEDYENLPHGDVNLILSKLPYGLGYEEEFTEEEIEQQHESIISKIVSHEYIHKSIDDEVLEWAIENNKTKGEYYAAHEIMAYVDMAHRETSNMAGFKARLFQLVGSHPILTNNPELADRIIDAMTRSRKGLKFQVPAEIKTIMQAFELSGFEILVVGGAVRDAVMGLTPKDYDLATNALPNEVNEVIAQIAGYRVVSTPEAQLARGVLTSLVLPPSGEVIEITTFRAELGYEEGTRRPIAVPAETFKEDSERRDFTMNALGWKLNGTILDYHDGLDDLEFGDLVSVGDANDRIKEDPLRILRAIRFHSRYGLDLDEDLSEAIGTHLNLLLTLSAERVRKELDSILKSEEGIYDLVNVGIVETLIPEYQGGYWGERNYDNGEPEFSFIADIQRYSMVDQPWQPSIVYALLFKNVVTKEEFNERYRRGPIAFSRAEADMIAELIELYPLLISEDDEVVSSPSNIVRIVTSPYYAELMVMADAMNESWLANYLAPYRQRYKGKPPKGYAMKVADAYSIEPSPALGDKISEITEAIILGDIEDWDEGLNYYAAESDKSLSPPSSVFKLKPFTKPILTYAEPYGQSPPQDIIDRGWWSFDATSLEWTPGLIWNIHLAYDPKGIYNAGQFCSDIKPTWIDYTSAEVGTRERIAYAGVILDETTSEQLLARFESEIPKDWTRDATFRSEVENNPGSLDIFYNWVEVDKRKTINIPATEYNDRYDIANVVVAYQGTIKKKFLGDFPSVVYFYIWKDIFNEKDEYSWYEQHSVNDGWECRCFECQQEGGPLFIDRQSGIYDKMDVIDLIAESVMQDEPYQSWFQDSRVSKLVRTLSIPITGMKITKPQVTHIQSYLEPDFYSGELRMFGGFWTSLLSSYYYSSKTNQSLRNLEERLVKNRMVTLNYPRNGAW
jgi:tRNA nucleotidyltransferase/poly(A) polymerase